MLIKYNNKKMIAPNKMKTTSIMIKKIIEILVIITITTYIMHAIPDFKFPQAVNKGLSV